jgi:hypothetical protein
LDVGYASDLREDHTVSVIRFADFGPDDGDSRLCSRENKSTQLTLNFILLKMMLFFVFPQHPETNCIGIDPLKHYGNYTYRLRKQSAFMDVCVSVFAFMAFARIP